MGGPLPLPVLRYSGASCGYERLNNLGGQDNGFDEGIDQPVHEG